MDPLHSTNLYKAPTVCSQCMGAEDIHEKGRQDPAPNDFPVGRASKQHTPYKEDSGAHGAVETDTERGRVGAGLF